jgi:CheY-like chemotaxis protein
VRITPRFEADGSDGEGGQPSAVPKKMNRRMSMTHMITSQSVPVADKWQPACANPFQPSADGKTAQAANRLRRDSESGRILIVDDDPGILKLVTTMAEHLGFRSTAAIDAMDALYHLSKTPFDMVITDYEMPLMDGFQLADMIKKKYFGTRVILMTGHCERMVADMMEGSDLVDGLLVKPFNLAVMKEKIESVSATFSAKWTT